ncbi:unnamed protein product [Auanema sp. JU1783]|nr:unnamed protein product [Auanema sp. JU1783]
MHIKRVEIDGFKSYAQKQVVDNFDLQFNAITGLNGSGKSNILDSICFVLGINDLKCIRAESMNALVYKSGQAGVNKATVTITFDNKDKTCGPLGYSSYDEIIVRRQVVVNGRNSYTINGSAITNAKVSDFFRGVGLNVNNPHFLIMQGRITKVLNMKPHEILGMVEEAAGTKMYEAKRISALSTIQKKEAKVDEINKLLQDQIKPTVERLKADRVNYNEWKKCERDIESAQRKLAAFVYQDSLRASEQLEEQSKELSQKLRSMEKEIEGLESKKMELMKLLDEKEQERKMKNNEERTDIDGVVKNAKSVLVEKEAERDSIAEEFTSNKKELERLEKTIESDKAEMLRNQAKLREQEGKFGNKEELGSAAEEAVKQAKHKLEVLAKGLTTNDKGEAVTLEAQITATRTELSEIQTAVKTAEMRQKKLLPELTQKKKELQTFSKKDSAGANEMATLETDIRLCQNNMKAISYNPEEDNIMQEKLPVLKQECQALSRKMSDILNRDARLEFTFTNPHQDFDRDAEIHGVACTLFKVKDPKYATAVETALGGSLFYVVVARQKVAAMLVDKGLVHSRRTFIPLDSLNVSSDKREFQAKFKKAQEIARRQDQDIQLAIDLIEYDPIYQQAMEYMLNGILVLEDPKLASDITYNADIKLRTVTTRGDDNRPNGTCSGGALEKKTPLLMHLLPYQTYRKELKAKKTEVEAISKKLLDMDSERKTYFSLKDTLDKSVGRLESLKESLKNTPLQLLKDEVEAIEKELPECQETIRSNQDRIKELNQKIKDYESRKKNEKAFQENEKKKLTAELKSAETNLDKLKSSFAEARSALDILRAGVEHLQLQIQQEKVEVESRSEELKILTDKQKNNEKELEDARQEVRTAEAVLEKFLGKLRLYDKDIKTIQQQIDDCKKKKLKYTNEIAVLERDIKKNEHDAVLFKKTAKKELEKNAWIDDEKIHFGRKDTDYDFTDYNDVKGSAQIQSIQEKKKSLEQTLNMTAMNLLGAAEERLMSLVRKKTQIESDKQKLLDTISLLDKKKEAEIIKAHTQVNRDFGNIFSTLLPGAGAKLDPPQGKTALEGLEVKVSFNGKWKDSLNELSGGQRSLVALSLVLAMLKFKPAPIYILDEVDSALDLSHTQNIGHMIKKHFTNSQFIIVSLKEGMFNHANVLYRTRFVDGTSMITRLENKN